MATAYDIIVGALQYCGAYAVGEPPNAAFGSMGLARLNQIRAQWNAEGVACYGLRVQTIASTGASSYTVAATGDIGIDVNGVRTVTISKSDGSARELTRITFDEYMALSNKTDQGEAEYFAFRPGSPGLLYLYPAQDTTANINVIARGRFAPIANQSDAIPEPAEYHLTMMAALAVVMAPAFGRPLDPTVSSLAAAGYAALKAQANNEPPPILNTDGGLSGSAYLDHVTEERAF